MLTFAPHTSHRATRAGGARGGRPLGRIPHADPSAVVPMTIEIRDSNTAHRLPFPRCERRASEPSLRALVRGSGLQGHRTYTKMEKLNNPRYCIQKCRRGLGPEIEEEGYACVEQNVL